MRIAIDLTSLDDNFSGLERYAMSLSKELIEAGSGDQFYLLFKNQIPRLMKQQAAMESVTPVIVRGKNRLLVNQLSLPLKMSSIPADVYLFPAFPVPLMFHKNNTFGLIADMTCFDCPDTMKSKARLFFRVMTKHTAKVSRGIFTISDFSEGRITDILQLKHPQIQKAYCGIERNDFIPNSAREKEIRDKYSLPERFLLSLSTIEPRKNIELLLKAYANLLDEKIKLPPLVLAGRNGWLMEKKINTIDDSIKDRIIFTGFIEEQDIATLYSMAECFIFPSKYEGFGMPPLEAQAAGVARIITSDTPALREVMADTATYFINEDARNLQNVLAKYREITPTTKQQREENLNRFSWRESAGNLRAWMELSYEPPKHRIKELVRSIIPRQWINRRNQLRDQKALRKTAEMISQWSAQQTTAPGLTQGVNLYGDGASPTGLGQSVRLIENLLYRSQMKYHYYAFPLEGEFRKTNYKVNLFHIQPAKWPEFVKTFPKECLIGHYNIAYWLWETPCFPKEWISALECFDEIWVPSEYIADAIKKVTEKPVTVIPYGMEMDEITNVNEIRKNYNIPKDAITYLIMYDSLSGLERKNPQAALQAFCGAFPKERENVWIILKGKHMSVRNRSHIQTIIKNYQNQIWIENTLEESAVMELLAMSDVLISLHHAEGFGLPLAEAMFQRTAVVATGWSGNMEFMKESNSCLVPYSMTTLKKDAGPYPKGTEWAKPDVEAAARWIRNLADQPQCLQDRKNRAGKEIRELLSVDAMTQRISKRLGEIFQMEE